MSTNCVQCVVNKRTGPDLLCDDCRALNHRKCIRCGCSQFHACEGGCAWVGDADVCDACLTDEEREFIFQLPQIIGDGQKRAKIMQLFSAMLNNPWASEITPASDWITDSLPDADMTVLMRTDSVEHPIWPGFHDGSTWCFADGGTVDLKVIGWMEIETATQFLDESAPGQKAENPATHPPKNHAS